MSLRIRLAVFLLVTTCSLAAPAAAQEVGVRGFADLGVTSFTASESFDAVFDSSIGQFFGGGVEVVTPGRLFGRLHASRFKRTGERVFVFNGQVFPLGVDNTVTIRPVEVTGGIRFEGSGRRPYLGRLIPYVGGGLGWHRYQESGEFGTEEEDVDETFTGYHLLGGAEVRVSRWVGAAFEAQWTTVPDALGQDPNGVSAAYGETNLGGLAFRARVIIGR